MSFRRLTPHRRKNLNRKLEIPSTENDVCAEFNYDAVKNAITDVENGLNELRKKVKATKKAREHNRRNNFEDAKQLLLDNIHSKFNSLNSAFHVTFSEITQLEETFRKLEEDYRVLKKEQSNQERKIKDLTFSLEERDKKLKDVEIKLSQGKIPNSSQESPLKEDYSMLKKEQSEQKMRVKNLTSLLEERDRKLMEKDVQIKLLQENVSNLTKKCAKTDDDRVNVSAYTELSDPNRPIKIAEKISDIFEYEWPKSIEALEAFDLEEKECVNILLHFLTDTYDACGKIVSDLDHHLKQALIVPECEEDEEEAPNQVVPAEILQTLKNLRLQLTENNLEILQKKLRSHLRKARTNVTDEHITACAKYVTDCIKYVWMIQIQDPQVYIEWDFPSGAKIEWDLFRSYTKSGDYIDYIVWPVIYEHKGGHLLCKGVVQPMSGSNN
ncbi:uncharacterized protein LOC127714094 isoform X2 [Mytilus californianus]|uniref:uncharacterized protein LOC127714094 isoform X1 n=1 Tax=Mytilus californianus TaxID=6549 RepID=UPI002245C025|nr:uncharacterized protein LOC127714094 isoform X1 [Mytilus californianus]XP_052076013.1 uncharacterized protein LOC127714094 isoform X2 [Mytilus californianus]